jgi:hypothetical protein
MKRIVSHPGLSFTWLTSCHGSALATSFIVLLLIGNGRVGVCRSDLESMNVGLVDALGRQKTSHANERIPTHSLSCRVAMRGETDKGLTYSISIASGNGEFSAGSNGFPVLFSRQQFPPRPVASDSCYLPPRQNSSKTSCLTSKAQWWQV